MKTRFVLINTSHAGNVGAAARAMKTMGFDDLVLVAPRWANVLRREETIQRASGALDVLAKARIVATLDEALDGMTHLCATAMTPRDFGPPTAAPRPYFEMLLKTEQTALDGQALEVKKASDPDGGAKPSPMELDGTCADGREVGALNEEDLDALDGSGKNNGSGSGIAFLFGSERFGMANDDVYRCHVALSIPTNPGFGSLNLGAAIQVIAYEWRMALGGFAVHDAAPARQLADAAQVAGMLAHWQEALVDIGFLDPAAPKKLMPRLNQLFNRAQLSPEEIHILRGVAKAMRLAAQAKR